MFCFASALLKLLHESVGSGGGCKFTELVMKCNWKVIRILPTRSNDLDLDQILLDVHNFLVVSIIHDTESQISKEAKYFNISHVVILIVY